MLSYRSLRVADAERAGVCAHRESGGHERVRRRGTVRRIGDAAEDALREFTSCGEIVDRSVEVTRFESCRPSGFGGSQAGLAKEFLDVRRTDPLTPRDVRLPVDPAGVDAAGVQLEESAPARGIRDL